MDTKSTRHAVVMLVAGFVMISVHKIWRMYLRDTVGLDPTADYFHYETMSTITRALGTAVGIGFCFWGLEQPRRQFGLGATWPAVILALEVPAYMVLRSVFFAPPAFEYSSFRTELLFNSFTGFYEEFVFRGMIFVGMYRFLGAWKSVVLSSLVFAVWHYDVSLNIPNMVFLFVTGAFYAIVMKAGGSLLIMSLVHFAWDQAVYGMRWPVRGGEPFTYMLVGLQAVMIAAVLITQRSAVPVKS